MQALKMQMLKDSPLQTKVEKPGQLSPGRLI